MKNNEVAMLPQIDLGSTNRMKYSRSKYISFILNTVN